MGRLIMFTSMKTGNNEWEERRNTIIFHPEQYNKTLPHEIPKRATHRVGDVVIYTGFIEAVRLHLLMDKPIVFC